MRRLRLLFLLQASHSSSNLEIIVLLGLDLASIIYETGSTHISSYCTTLIHNIPLFFGCLHHSSLQLRALFTILQLYSLILPILQLYHGVFMNAQMRAELLIVFFHSQHRNKKQHSGVAFYFCFPCQLDKITCLTLKFSLPHQPQHTAQWSQCIFSYGSSAFGDLDFMDNGCTSFGHWDNRFEHWPWRICMEAAFASSSPGLTAQRLPQRQVEKTQKEKFSRN